MTILINTFIIICTLCDVNKGNQYYIKNSFCRVINSIAVLSFNFDTSLIINLVEHLDT